MHKLSEKQRKVLSELHDVALTGAQISNVTGIPPQRGLAGILISLYKHNLVYCPSISPIRYQATDLGREAIKSELR